MWDKEVYPLTKSEIPRILFSKVIVENCVNNDQPQPLKYSLFNSQPSSLDVKSSHSITVVNFNCYKTQTKQVMCSCLFNAIRSVV